MTAVGASGEAAEVCVKHAQGSAASEARVWLAGKLGACGQNADWHPECSLAASLLCDNLQRGAAERGARRMRAQQKSFATARSGQPASAAPTPDTLRYHRAAAGRTCLGRREQTGPGLTTYAPYNVPLARGPRRVRPAVPAPWRICHSQRLSASRALLIAFPGQTKRARAIKAPSFHLAAESRAQLRTAAAVLRSALPDAAPPGGSWWRGCPCTASWWASWADPT